MPLVGFGLWKVDKATCAETVYNAIRAGYRLFDCASDYGNEVEVGQGLARAISENLVSREQLFITSKLWCSNHARDHVVPAFEKTLGDLGLEYLDLYLIHFPISVKYVPSSERYPPGFFNDAAGTKVVLEKSPMYLTWAGMEEIHGSGRAKNIGVSNFNGQLITDMLRYCNIPPAVLQIEHHPYYVQRELTDFCEHQGIKVTAYSSFGPMSYLELKQELAVGSPPLLEHPVVKQVAEECGKSPAQVLLRWATQRGIAVIPKSNNVERLTQNLECCSFDLNDEQMTKITGLDQKLKFNSPQNYGIPIYGTFA